jgi:hypothetical protein
MIALESTSALSTIFVATLEVYLEGVAGKVSLPTSRAKAAYC